MAMALGNFVFLFFTGRLLAKICHKIEKYKRYSLAIASYKLQEPVWQLSLQLSCDNVITGSPAMVKLLIFGQITNVIEYKINWKNNKIIFICGVILEQLRCYKISCNNWTLWFPRKLQMYLQIKLKIHYLFGENIKTTKESNIFII